METQNVLAGKNLDIIKNWLRSSLISSLKKTINNSGIEFSACLYEIVKSTPFINESSVQEYLIENNDWTAGFNLVLKITKDTIFMLRKLKLLETTLTIF
jgi:hypothetical protein